MSEIRLTERTRPRDLTPEQLRDFWFRLFHFGDSAFGYADYCSSANRFRRDMFGTDNALLISTIPIKETFTCVHCGATHTWKEHRLCSACFRQKMKAQDPERFAIQEAKKRVLHRRWVEQKKREKVEKAS